MFFFLFRSLYLIKVPFYWGGRFLFVSGFTRDFPVVLPGRRQGQCGGRREKSIDRKVKWQLAPMMEKLTGPPLFGGLTCLFGSYLIFFLR